MAENGSSATVGRIEIEHLSKSYQTSSHRVDVLRDVSFQVEAGGMLAIVGPSGSGKSTLLHIIGGLEVPSEGSVLVDGFAPSTASDAELASYRSRCIGFVFQDHHLLPQYTLLQNVVLPSLAVGKGSSPHPAEVSDRALRLLELVGLTERQDHRPAELSGGERQRGAIARALINRPSVLLCDEPTGNLDHKTASSVADLLFDLHAEEGGSLIAVTHSLELAAKFSRSLTLEDGSC